MVIQDIRYKKNYLFRVIFRVDFSSEIQQSREKLVAFEKDVKPTFKRADDQTLRGFQATISKDGFTHEEAKIPLYKFTDTEKAKILTFEPSALTLELAKYTVFDDFKEITDLVLNQFRKVYGDITVARAGLRYINTITLPKTKSGAFKWDNLIATELISAIDFPKNPEEITRIMTVLELKKSDYRVLFRFGLYNSEYPNTIAKKEFALDYDCYTTEECELAEIPELITTFNNEIRNLFEASIKKALRDKMGVVANGF
jgi:uncharacterized protein (TIGR04255 family)